MKRPTVLIILDGWGYSEYKENNAIHEAKTPFFDELWQSCPRTLLSASGLEVGLPDGQIGNSEVGHQTIGSGKVIDTDLVRISKAFESDEINSILAFSQLFDHVINNNSILHIIGLLGPGGIHSHKDHLRHFLSFAKKNQIKKIAIHAFTDGRDTPPQSAYSYLKELEELLSELSIGLISTVIGRYWAMDRDNNWDRISKATAAIFNGKGDISPLKPSETIKNMYKHNLTDEYIEPIIFLDDNRRSYPINKNDGIFFFNFRSDRARQLAKKISEKKDKKNLFFVTMTNYSPEIACEIAFPPSKIETTLAKEISQNGLSQVHIAETEKYAHATYFLNGGQSDPYNNEEHILVESRKDIPTHDLAPEMKVGEITDVAINYLNERNTDFIFINYASPDIVGHTANKQAIIKSIEFLDKELNRLFEAISKQKGIAVITADHGNAEMNVDSKGKPHTAHTTNKVPFILYGENYTLKNNGSLADIAPTILDLLKLPIPDFMTGTRLINGQQR